MKVGYTKAYRKELNSDIWKMPPLYQRVFFYLRQEAVWQPETFPTRKGYGIALNPGQLITSFSTIAEGVSWYEYGVKKVPNKKIIKDILEWLEGNSMVTVFSNRHGTFIMLINWDTYNSVENEKVTQNNQPKVTQKKRSVDTLKEGKEPLRSKEINKKKINKRKTLLPDNYELEKRHIDYANSKGITDNLNDIFEGFCINHRKRGTQFVDWYATWQTWIRNKVKWNKEKQEKANNGTKLPKVDYSDIRGRDD